MILYRYISFQHFKQLVENKELRFVNPLTEWEDKKEAYLFRQAQRKKGLKEICRLLDKPSNKSIISQIKHGNVVDMAHTSSYPRKIKGFILKKIKYHYSKPNDWFGIRCQSWCKERDSKEMWRNYDTDNTAVMISAELIELRKLSYKEYRVEGLEVKYRDRLLIKDEIDNSVGTNRQFYFPLIIGSKSMDYSFEKEYRLYIVPLREKIQFPEMEELVIEPLPPIIKIQINPSSLIQEVLANPNADEKFIENVRFFCENNEINFSGKSLAT